MPKDFVSLRFMRAANTDPANVAEFLFLFRATYGAAHQLFKPSELSSPTPSAKQMAKRLSRHIKSLDPSQLEQLFYRDLGTLGLSVVRFSHESPLEFLFYGEVLVTIIVIAVILAGGKFEIDGLKFEISLPLGEAIRKLREGLRREKPPEFKLKINRSLKDTTKAMRRDLTQRDKNRIGYGVRWTRVKLTKKEFLALNQPHRGRGGFQTLQASLQRRVNRRSRVLELNGADIERIIRYSREYKGGGFQSTLQKVFGKHFRLDK